MAQVNTGLVNQLENLLGVVKPYKKHIKGLIKYSQLTSNPVFIILNVLSTLLCLLVIADLFFGWDIMKEMTREPKIYYYVFWPSLAVFIVTAFQKHSAKRFYQTEADCGVYSTLVNSNPRLSDAFLISSNLKRMIRVLKSGKASDFRSAVAAAKIKDKGREVNIEKLNKELEKINKQEMKRAKKAQSAGETAEGIFIIFSLLWKLITLPFTIMDGIWNVFFDSPEEIIERSRAESERTMLTQQIKLELERDGWRKY